MPCDPRMSEWGNPAGVSPSPALLRTSGRTWGTETSKYPEEEKITMIAQVVASERARAQTGAVHCCRARGCRTGAAPRHQSSGTLWKVGP